MVRSRALLASVLSMAVVVGRSTHAPVWQPHALPLEVQGHGQYEFTLYNHLSSEYYVKMLVGSPPQPVRILPDTAGIDLAVIGTEVPPDGGHHLFNHSQSTSYRFDGRNVTLSDHSSGFLVQDTVSFASTTHGDAVFVDGQYFTEISNISFYRDLFKNMRRDGVLGLGPSSAQSVGGVPSLVQSLMDKHALQLPFVGISMPRHDNGKLYVGGMPRELESSLQSQVTMTLDPKRKSWGLDIKKITVGDKEVPLGSGEPTVSGEPARLPYGTLDNTGMMHGPRASLEAIADALGGDLTTVNRTISVPCAAALPDVTFWIEDDFPITVTKEDYVMHQIAEDKCLTFFIHPRQDGGPDWVLGMPVFYSHFIGFFYEPGAPRLMLASQA